MAGLGSPMPAVQYTKYGGNSSDLQHVELPIPAPKTGEVLVKVEAASINPIDWKIQSGLLKAVSPIKFPYIPCTDIAGEVVGLGPDVSEFVVGDKVAAYLTIKSGGGFGKYAVAPVKCTAKRPPEVSACDAAALPVAGSTAFQSLRDCAGVKFDGSYSGNILVTAASGGVGTYAVQLAKLAGAYVTATCGARNMELVKRLGADEVLDYKTPEGAALKSSSGCKFDAVIHCATGMYWSTFQPVLAQKAKVIDLTPTLGGFIRYAFHYLTFSKQRMVPFFTTPNSKDLQILLDLVKDGKLSTIVDSEYSIKDADQAWKKSLEGHATGKVLVVLDGN